MCRDICGDIAHVTGCVCSAIACPTSPTASQSVRTTRTFFLLVRILRTTIARYADTRWQDWERPSCEDSESPLRAWYTHVSNKNVAWQNWSDVKASFGNADLVGNCVVFNIGGNKYRLIARILYPSQKVFILKVMTHKEYDQDKWKDECGCFAGPPKKVTVQRRRT